MQTVELALINNITRNLVTHDPAHSDLLLSYSSSHTIHYAVSQVVRSAVMDTVLSAFQEVRPEKLLGKLSCGFQGEGGIDAGGLTSEMFR